MKHILPINEFYHRTMGFRYSDPTMAFKVKSSFKGTLTKDEVLKSLDSIFKLKYEFISLNDEAGIITISDADGTNYDVKIDGNIEFEIIVYSEKEVEKIIELFNKEIQLSTKAEIVENRFSEKPQ